MSENPLSNLKPEDAQKVESGFGDMKQVFTSLGLMSALDKFQEMTKFNAADPALAKFAGELDKKTLDSRVALMKSLYDAIETPATQLAIDTFSVLINSVINGATDLVNSFTAAQTMYPALEQSDGKIDTLSELMRELATNADYLDKAVDRFFDNLIPGWNELAKTIENMGKIMLTQTQAQDQLSPGSDADFYIDPVFQMPDGTYGNGNTKMGGR